MNQWLPDDAKRSTGRISTTTLGQLASMSSCLIKDLADRTTQDHGLYNGNADPGGVTPSRAQVSASCDDRNWHKPSTCVQGDSHKYSNWGTLTLAFAVCQPDGYDYDKSLKKMILRPLGLSSATNTDVHTKTVTGYQPNHQPATGKAHGIRSTTADMAQFVGEYLFYMMKTMYADLRPDFKDRYWSPIISLALKAPYKGLKWGLDWQIGTVTVGGKTFPKWSKNGMTGQQGFSAYVAFAQTATPAPSITPLGQVGAIVLVNKNMQRSDPNPTRYGNAVIEYLLGNTAKPTWTDQSDPAEDVLEDEDPPD